MVNCVFCHRRFILRIVHLSQYLRFYLFIEYITLFLCVYVCVISVKVYFISETRFGHKDVNNYDAILRIFHQYQW